MSRRALIVAAAGALVLVPAARADVELKRIDVRDYPTVRAAVITSAPVRHTPVLRENGKPVSGLSAENLGRSRSVVLALDTSRSMSGQPLQEAIAAARSFVATKQAADRIAVVAFGAEAVALTGFSTARIDADSALRSLAVDEREGTALHDAVRVSARALRSEPAGGRVVILLTDGRDVSSQASFATAVASARKARASVYPIGVEGEQFAPGALQRIARETGGSYRGAASTQSLARIYAEIGQELRRTWRVEYLTAARPGERLRLRATAVGHGSTTETVRLPQGDAEDSPAAGFLPEAVHESLLARLLFSLLIGALVLLAVRLLLNRPPKPKGGSGTSTVAATREAAEKAARTGSTSLAALYRVTEEKLDGKRAWLRLEAHLQRADLPLRAAELVWLSLACALIAGLVLFLLDVRAAFVLAATVAAGIAPAMYVSHRARRRVRAFEEQLPDILIALAASLRAGHSLRQAIQASVAEGGNPAKKEFGRVLAEASLGRPMEEALADMARRLDSDDFHYVVTAIAVQRQVGGALAGLFDMVADTVRARQQFKRKVRSLTAMGRLSALILIGLPFLVAAALTALNPEYMSPLYDSSAGHTLIVIGVVMMVIGSLLLRRIVSFRG